MDEATLQKRLGTAMRSRRTTLGYSQDSFADAIGMHRAYYSAIERGERNLTLQTMVRVAEGLEVRPSELLKAAGS
jgi:transcriptional regulator with XRE-family HTH domain